MYYMLWIVDGKLWSTYRCVIIIAPVGAQQRRCHYLPTIIDHWSCLSLSAPQTQFICCFIIWTESLSLLPVKYYVFNNYQNVETIIAVVAKPWWTWIGSDVLEYSCELSYMSVSGSAMTYGRVACDNMEQPASWCRSGHCQKDLQRQSQQQAHWGHLTRFEISDARPQLSFSNPLASTWVIVQSPIVPTVASPSVSSPQNVTAQLIQQDFLRSQTFWDRALRRGGGTFMFWHLPHQWTVDGLLAGWAKLFAFCRQFSLFHSFVTKMSTRFPGQ